MKLPFFSRSSAAKIAVKAPARGPACTVEPLECRLLMSTSQVSALTDGSHGFLVPAVHNATANGTDVVASTNNVQAGSFQAVKAIGQLIGLL